MWEDKCFTPISKVEINTSSILNTMALTSMYYLVALFSHYFMKTLLGIGVSTIKQLNNYT